MTFVVKKRKHRYKGRRGFLLVDVSVAVALSSIVLGLVVSVAVALKQMDRRMQNAAVERERQLELAELIRADIRLAAEVALTSDKKLVVRWADERQTDYEIVSGGIRRTARLPDDQTKHTDLFAIHAADAWEIERVESGRRALVMVTLRRKLETKPQANKPVPFVVYAVLGADLPANDESGE